MLALIPARCGSKGIPKKNIKLLNGKPLIAHTIESAEKSRLVSKIICSTDCEEIADVAKEYGAEIPFLRPKKLAKDTSKAIDNYIYSIPKYEEYYNTKFEEFVVLQPTSPLRISEDIDNAISLFREKSADSIISFYEYDHPPTWAKKIDKNLKIKNYLPNPYEGCNRQEIPKAYMPNGAIFVFKYSILKKNKKYYTDKSHAYIMPQERSVDIDTMLDFEFAEFLIQKNLL